MIDIQYRPITRWPGKLRAAHQRTRAPFKAGHTDTLEVLARELRMVSAESAVVQLALSESQFTKDGRPYYQARPEHPGVIVSFRKPVRDATGRTTVKIPLNFPADRFTSWEANLRAVAIALEDLRRIDRYGVTQNSEQYVGFKALPPPGPTHDAIATADEAARFVEVVTRVGAAAVLADSARYREAYRSAAAKLHPDAAPMAAAEWAKLQAAKALLVEHNKAVSVP
jgi:hypothetical protein